MTRSERALKIAEFLGWELHESDENEVLYYHKDKDEYSNDWDLVDEYSDFNGLMPVFATFNTPNKSWFRMGSDESENVISVGVILNPDWADWPDLADWDDLEIEYDPEKPETLIDALQEAIIFYYENRGSNEN